jgi:hypothetical protein
VYAGDRPAGGAHLATARSRRTAAHTAARGRSGQDPTRCRGRDNSLSPWEMVGVRGCAMMMPERPHPNPLPGGEGAPPLPRKG